MAANFICSQQARTHTHTQSFSFIFLSLIETRREIWINSSGLSNSYLFFKEKIIIAKSSIPKPTVPTKLKMKKRSSNDIAWKTSLKIDKLATEQAFYNKLLSLLTPQDHVSLAQNFKNAQEQYIECKLIHITIYHLKLKFTIFPISPEE